MTLPFILASGSEIRAELLRKAAVPHRIDPARVDESAIRDSLAAEGASPRDVADALRADVLAYAPDHVAMTGDVTNFGLEREFAAGADWLSGFGPGRDVSFVPGNHEAIQGGVAAARDSAFNAYIGSDEGAGWPSLRRRGPVGLIGVSTSVATPPFFAQGEVGKAQIALMAAGLRAAQLAQPGDAVLLSPACASFDMYDSYVARGDDFSARAREVAHG